jgi:hypothetical protein
MSSVEAGPNQKFNLDRAVGTVVMAGALIVGAEALLFGIDI